jgi:4-amino-4-deoxy-L-arabinose transferase-like glycosyltransferase
MLPAPRMSGRGGAGSSARPLSRWTAGLVLVLLAALLALRAGDPWRYLHDDNGRRYSSYGRTHLALGLARTGGHDYFFDRRDGRLVPYGHHPPGLGLVLAGWFRLTGTDGPRAARTLAAAFHLASAVLVLGLLRRHYPGAPGVIAALAFAVVPMSSFFGKMVNFEPFVLPFVIGAVIAYFRWAEGGATGWLALAFFLVLLGTLFDWPALLALSVLAGDALRRWWRGEGPAFAAAAVAACVFGLALGGTIAVWASGPVGLAELGRAYSYRLRLHGHYPWWRLVGKLLDYNRRYFTEPVLAASLIAAGLLVRDAWGGRRLAPRARLLALFGAVGIVPVVGFPSSARYHAYWQFYLLPYATLALAHVLDALGGRLAPARRRLAHAAVLTALVVASTHTLWVRYSRPSGYVARKVREFTPYL